MASVKDRIAAFANTEIGWSFLMRLSRFDRMAQRLIRFAERHRSLKATEDFYSRVKAGFSDQQVRHGPFKGLRYAGLQSQGSMLLPKFLGSYEDELHPYLAEVATRDYGMVVDIGCAEGYYAVGLARLLPSAQVLAYDIEEASRESCRRLARENDVIDRITIGDFCSADVLKALDYPGRTLIFSDCEGYETELFREDVIPHISNADLVIECHDHIKGQPITRDLISVFSETHTAQVIETTADHRKALDLELPELTGEPYEVRLYMVEEMRTAPQNFLILEARRPE